MLSRTLNTYKLLRVGYITLKSPNGICINKILSWPLNKKWREGINKKPLSARSTNLTESPLKTASAVLVLVLPTGVCLDSKRQDGYQLCICVFRYISSKSRAVDVYIDAKSLHRFRKPLKKLKLKKVHSSYMKKHHLSGWRVSSATNHWRLASSHKSFEDLCHQELP